MLNCHLGRRGRVSGQVSSTTDKRTPVINARRCSCHFARMFLGPTKEFSRNLFFTSWEKSKDIDDKRYRQMKYFFTKIKFPHTFSQNNRFIDTIFISTNFLYLLSFKIYKHSHRTTGPDKTLDFFLKVKPFDQSGVKICVYQSPGFPGEWNSGPGK